MNTDFYPVSRIFIMDVDELFVVPDRIWPSLDFSGIYGNTNALFLFGIIFPPFGIPAMIGGVGCCLFMGFAWFDVISARPSV